MAMYGTMFLVTQYFQLVLGYSPLNAAARLLPMAMILLVMSLFTPRITERFGVNRTVAAGMVSLGCGLLLLSRLGLDTEYWYIICCFVPFSCGMALAMSPSTASIMSAVPARRAGMGSAMNDATRELGAALGIAVLGSIAASRYASLITPAVGDLRRRRADRRAQLDRRRPRRRQPTSAAGPSEDADVGGPRSRSCPASTSPCWRRRSWPSAAR